jgi:predicted phage baseplate assembly protein
MGRAPAAGEAFSASYRVDLNAAGHIGAESIAHALFRPGTVAPGALTPRNPLPASGRIAPQSIAEARAIGPGTTSELSRAVTADDYAELARRNPRVQRAAAVLLWTGSRCEARVAIDPLGSEAVDDQLLRAIRAELEQYRSIGHDLVVVPPTYVPIDLCIIVQVIPGHSRAHVERALRDAFSNRVLSDGSKGFFHPDNLTFGQNLEVGRVMAAAQAVSGVQSVQVKTLERMFPDPGQQLANGILTIGPMEVPRLDNTPSQPENGRLVITLRGGR